MEQNIKPIRSKIKKSTNKKISRSQKITILCVKISMTEANIDDVIAIHHQKQPWSAWS